MQQGFKNIAQRIENAGANFVENAMSAAPITKQQGEQLLQIYRKARVIKLDAASGVYRVKHGAFWDKETILNALGAK